MTIDAPKWSIGIYQGKSPFALASANNNPVLHALDISDLEADFIADPFMVRHQEQWFLFFETLPKISSTSIASDKYVPESTCGVIGLAISNNGIDWHYQGTVLREPWHLSYPHVFEVEGVHYMLPETLGADCIRLYRADKFPTHWSPVADLLPGRHADATPFYYRHHWWIFSCPTPESHDTLELHFASHLIGPWYPHPKNPLIDRNARIARPAGRVLVWQDKIFRFAQDCVPRYGSQVRMFEITHLSKQEYAEQECEHSPLLVPTGHGWNGRNMHHIDLHQQGPEQWIACVDGYHLTK